MIRLSLVGVRVEVAYEPADRPAARGRRPALPADLHRHARGDGDRLRPPGHGHAAADDPRPLQARARRPVGASWTQVEITELHDGTFYAKIALDRAASTRIIDSRPSDAIALAVRYGADVPIFAEEAVLDEAGVLFDQEEERGGRGAGRAVPRVHREGPPEDFAQ